jgi:hypothetical protein
VQGKIPSPWKRVNVRPIYKKGSKTTTSNYRPVTLNSILCKILESIIKSTIQSHLTTYNLINNEQHGFMKNRSTITNLIEFIDLITYSINNHLTVHIAYLDFVKAFDKVPHHYLLHKLSSYGISGSLLEWCRSFLCDRMQRVSLNGTYSTWKHILSGVIQGSVLGPLFYVIYINDLLESITSRGFLYADDTNVVSVSPTPPTLTTHPTLQSDLDKIYSWSKLWHTPLNLEKCFTMHIDRPCSHHHPTYSMNSIPLTPCHTIKNLGVLFSSDLSWSKHIQCLTSSTLRLIRQLHRALPSPSISTIRNLILAIVSPRLEYANIIWLPTSIVDNNTLESVLRKATKWGRLRHHSYKSRLSILNIGTLKERRDRQDCIQLYKHFSSIQRINWLNPPYIPNRPTRGHCLKYSPEPAKHHTFQPRFNFLTNRANALWNSLPEAAVKAPSISTFKSEFDRFHNLAPQRSM